MILDSNYTNLAVLRPYFSTVNQYSFVIRHFGYVAAYWSPMDGFIDKIHI